METLGIPMACSHSTIHLLRAARSPGRFGQRSSSGKQVQQNIFVVRASQCARSTSSPVMPPFSSIDEKNCLLGTGNSTSRSERLESERSSLSRLDVELMLRRIVRAEEEKSEKDAGEGMDKTDDSGHQVWIRKARNMQTTTKIFCSMMFWIMLFFITSIWDGENPGRNRRRDRGRRK